MTACSSRSPRWHARLTLLLAGSIFCSCHALAAEGDTATAEAAAVRAQARPLVVGRTTLEAAEAAWREGGARPVQKGNLAIGFGSGADAFGKIGLDQVLLVDVEEVDFERFKAARYGFVDGVLYSVQVSLGLDLSKQKSVASQELSQQELEALEARLRKEHGQPAREARDLFAGKRPNILVWRVGGDELTLARSIHTFLRLENPALAKKVLDYRKAACRKHDQGRKVKECW
jgi:hypothetical protein